ncbi:hypothetical protein KW791_03540 [Candidatus Parcubacteria bacterium]|nr:hypothetical protein [Candidatus Parcubacteria bacterium]
MTCKLFVIVAVAVASFACEAKGPITPTPTTTSTPTPQYETLPARHCAVDTNGVELPGCRMSVMLMSVAPARGSQVKLGPVNCLDGGCFQAQAKYHFEGIDNPAVMMKYELYFSHDGKTPSSGMLADGAILAGEKQVPYGLWIFQTADAPKYLLAHLSHMAGGAGDSGYKDPVEDGWTAFLLDYK